MRGRFSSFAALCVAAAVSTAGGRGALAADAPDPEKGRLVAQKQALVNRLLWDSPVVRNVESGGDAAARAYLATARAQHAKALELIKAGETAGADTALNEAMWLVGKARERSPDTSARLIEQRVRYAELSASLESLRASYVRHRGRAGAAEDAILVKADRAAEAARSFANSDQLREANQALAEAETVLMRGLSQALGPTLDYSPRFASPVEEYRFELERNRSFAELVPVATGEFRPDAGALRQVRQQVENNRILRDEAERLASRHDYDRALAALRAGTEFLQRALAVAGLTVPADPGDR